MDVINLLFGQGKDLNSLQMVCRAVLIFFIALVLLRIAGIRTLGNKTALDWVIIIILGSVLSRAVAGASPFVPTVMACLAFSLIHQALGWLGCVNKSIGRWIKGERIMLYRDGELQQRNMRRVKFTEHDLLEAVRIQLHQELLEKVKEIYLERTGEVSILLEDEERKVK